MGVRGEGVYNWKRDYKWKWNTAFLDKQADFKKFYPPQARREPWKSLPTSWCSQSPLLLWWGGDYWCTLKCNLKDTGTKHILGTKTKWLHVGFLAGFQHISCFVMVIVQSILYLVLYLLLSFDNINGLSPFHWLTKTNGHQPLKQSKRIFCRTDWYSMYLHYAKWYSSHSNLAASLKM